MRVVLSLLFSLVLLAPTLADPVLPLEVTLLEFVAGIELPPDRGQGGGTVSASSRLAVNNVSAPWMSVTPAEMEFDPLALLSARTLDSTRRITFEREGAGFLLELRAEQKPDGYIIVDVSVNRWRTLEIEKASVWFSTSVRMKPENTLVIGGLMSGASPREIMVLVRPVVDPDVPLPARPAP